MDWIDLALLAIGVGCSLFALIMMLSLLIELAGELEDRRDALRARRRRRRSTQAPRKRRG